MKSIKYFSIFCSFITILFPSISFPISQCIEEVSPPQTLYGSNSSAEIWAKVATPDDVAIAHIWAKIFSPDPGDAPIIHELLSTDNNIYKRTYDGFTQKGYYMISIYAEDTAGLFSEPMATSVNRQDLTADQYELDDSVDDASSIFLKKNQNHNFHDKHDVDWVQFYALEQVIYKIEVTNHNDYSQAVIDLIDIDGATILINNGNGSMLSFNWECPVGGVYYLKIYNSDPDYYGENIVYEIGISNPTAGDEGWITGNVYDHLTNKPIKRVKIKTNGIGSAISNDSGAYELNDSPADYVLIAETDNYQTYTTNVIIGKSSILVHDIYMLPAGYVMPGDLNDDNKIDLSDLVMCLKIISGMEVATNIQADVDGDHKIGVEESVYILHYILFQK